MCRDCLPMLNSTSLLRKGSRRNVNKASMRMRKSDVSYGFVADRVSLSAAPA